MGILSRPCGTDRDLVVADLISGVPSRSADLSLAIRAGLIGLWHIQTNPIHLAINPVPRGSTRSWIICRVRAPHIHRDACNI